MSDEPRTCPWCKSSLVAMDRPMQPAGGNQVRVICDRCGAKGPCGEGRAVAVESWNRLSRMESTLEAIRAAVREYHEALDQRRSGSVAQGRAFDKILAILDMPWRPGGGS